MINIKARNITTLKNKIPSSFKYPNDKNELS